MLPPPPQEPYSTLKPLLIPNYITTLHFGTSWQFHDDSNLDMDAVLMTFNKRGVHLETIEGLGRTASMCGGIQHFGDSVTGVENGDAETIAVTLAKLDPRTACIVLVALLPRGTFLTAGVDSIRSRVLAGVVAGDEDGDGLDDDTQRAREFHLGDEMMAMKRDISAPPPLSRSSFSLASSRNSSKNASPVGSPRSTLSRTNSANNLYVTDDRENNMMVLNRMYRNPQDKHRWLCDELGLVNLNQSIRQAVPLTQYALIDLYPKIKIPGRKMGINTVKDLMNKMDVKVINKLEREFVTNTKGGLSVHEFIACMLKHVVSTNHEKEEKKATT
jgi:hypothetical protein